MEDGFSPPGDGISDLLLLFKVHNVLFDCKGVCGVALRFEVGFVLTLALLMAVFRAVVISVTVTVGIIDELFSIEPPNVEENKFNAMLTGTEFDCIPVNAEVTAAAEGVKVEFLALKSIKADAFSDVTVSDTLLDLLDVKFGSSVCVLSWNLRVDVPPNM